MWPVYVQLSDGLTYVWRKAWGRMLNSTGRSSQIRTEKSLLDLPLTLFASEQQFSRILRNKNSNRLTKRWKRRIRNSRLGVEHTENTWQRLHGEMRLKMGHIWTAESWERKAKRRIKGIDVADCLRDILRLWLRVTFQVSPVRVRPLYPLCQRSEKFLNQLSFF